MKQIFLVLSLIFTFPAAAQETAGSNVSSDKSNEALAITLGVQDYEYEESGFTNLDGKLLRLGAQFRNLLPGERGTPLWYSVDLGYTWGGTDFTGGLQNGAGGTTPITKNSRERIYDIEPHFGATFFDSAQHGLDVYSGLGFQSVNSRLRGSNTYTRDTNYFYALLGLQYSYKPTPWISLVGGAQYNHVVSGKSSLELSQQDPTFFDITKNFSTGHGMRFSLAGEMHGWLFSPLIEIYHQSWEIGNSLTERRGTLTFTSPASQTSITGLNLGWRFSEL